MCGEISRREERSPQGKRRHFRLNDMSNRVREDIDTWFVGRDVSTVFDGPNLCDRPGPYSFPQLARLTRTITKRRGTPGGITGDRLPKVEHASWSVNAAAL